MPAALVEKLSRARTFDQGFATTEYLAAALLDMAWYLQPAGMPVAEVEDFERSALQKFKIDVPEIPPRYHSTYFSHIWSNGYSAGYYGYIWSELLDDDAYYWFKENGGLTRANGEKFRKMILAPRGSADLAELYRAFRGRDPIADPLLIERGLKPSN